MHPLLALCVAVSSSTPVAPENTPASPTAVATKAPSLAGRDRSWAGALAGASVAVAAGAVFGALMGPIKPFVNPTYTAVALIPAVTVVTLLAPLTTYFGHLLLGGQGGLEWAVLGALVGTVAGPVLVFLGLPLFGALLTGLISFSPMAAGLVFLIAAKWTTTSAVLPVAAMVGAAVGAVAGLQYAHDKRVKISASVAPLASGGAMFSASVTF